MRIEDLGKRAAFMIPSVKVYNRKYSKKRQSIAKKIHKFLIKTFNGYTCASGNIYGYFTSEAAEYDESREFRVAFKEDERRTKVPKLQEFLADICKDIGEECIYLECGEDAMLVYPDTSESKTPAKQKKQKGKDKASGPNNQLTDISIQQLDTMLSQAFDADDIESIDAIYEEYRKRGTGAPQ